MNKFDQNAEAVAARDFTFAGRRFVVGEVFPHKDLKVDRSDLGGLWTSGCVRFGESVKSNEPAQQVDAITTNAKLDELARLTEEAGLYGDPDERPSAMVTLTLTPGETIAVTPPAQRALGTPPPPPQPPKSKRR